MRTFLVGLVASALLAACASSPGARSGCHRAARPDSVGPDGELHYPEVCTAATTPAPAAAPEPAPIARDPRSQALAKLRVDTPDPCRQYAQEHCTQGDSCEDVVKQINQLTTHKRRPYAQCVALLKHAQRVSTR